MTRKYIILLVVLGFFFVAARYNLSDYNNKQDDKLPVKVSTFRTTAGWGYEIVVDGKIFIHQEHIPAIEGKKSFKSQEEALKVGGLLLEKMKNRKVPVITVEELKCMRITGL